MGKKAVRNRCLSKEKSVVDISSGSLLLKGQNDKIIIFYGYTQLNLRDSRLISRKIFYNRYKHAIFGFNKIKIGI